MADINRLIGFMSLMQVPFMNDPDALMYIEEVKNVLKSQEPMEPKVDVDEWRCGNCGHKLEHQELLGENVLFHEQYSYCPQCGRRVKWE